MRRWIQWRNPRGVGLARDNEAAQLVEFAVALPLLVVFVVGIFDFSSAYTLKARLTSMARDAAHAAAADPATDVQSGATAPASVVDALQIVDNYLLANNLNDCGILSATPAYSGLTWTYTATGNGCPPGGITLVVNRGYYFPATGTASLPTDSCTAQAPPNGGAAIIGTCVCLQYPYAWKFGRAASLLGSNNTLPPYIPAIGVSLNEN